MLGDQVYQQTSPQTCLPVCPIALSIGPGIGQEYVATETAATLTVIATLSTVTKRRYHGICR